MLCYVNLINCTIVSESPTVLTKRCDSETRHSERWTKEHLVLSLNIAVWS